MTSDRVPDALRRALARRGYETLTPVQRAVLAAGPGGRDLLVSAPTGSGKTVAFGLALGGDLLDPEARAAAEGAPRALVVTPTRELAQQVAGELAWLYAEAGARVACCVGGAGLGVERARLGAGCDVVVGSPGRLRDHAARGTLALGRVATVVLDEADDMLQMGFRDDLDFLLAAAPPARRTLMFSATLGPRVEALAARYQQGAVRVAAGEAASAGDGIRFEAVSVAAGDREAAVANVLRLHEAPGAIVFCARRETVARMAGWLGARGFAVVALSGDLAQRERAAAVAALREGRARVCVATDLAARGLDLPGLELVVHADLPASAAALTHRSGRTGRAGRRGRAVLLAPHALRRRAEVLAARAGVALEWVAAPGREAILARDEARLSADAARAAAACPEERAAAARLLAAHDAERIAVALLRERARARPAPEALGAAGGGGGVWFAIDRGRAAGAEPRALAPFLCRLGRVERRDLGRIRVRRHETVFEIAAPVAERFAATAAAAAAAAGLALRRAGPPAEAGG